MAPPARLIGEGGAGTTAYQAWKMGVGGLMGLKDHGHRGIHQKDLHTCCKDVTTAVHCFQNIKCFSMIRKAMTNQPNLKDNIMS